jgi:hypothetical protein
MQTVKHRFITHVFKRGEDWIVRSEGSMEPLSLHRTQAQAVRAATNMARLHEPSQVKVHKEDDTFQEELNFGDDAQQE